MRKVISNGVKLIVGLGNPGRKYKNSRHNLGYKVVERLSKELNSSFKKKLALESLLAEAKIEDKKVILALPITFMNLSGRAVKALIKKKNIVISDLLIVCDEASLGLGVVRIRPNGSSSGHKGLANIIEELGTNEFCRLRLGIKGDSLKGNIDLSEYVLSEFNKGEKTRLSSLVSSAVGCVKTWALEGVNQAMNRFN